jgi:hypothetical protein
MKAKLGTIFLILVWAPLGWASGPSTSAGITLTQPIGARAASVGEAYTAMTGEVFCLYYNPASSAFIQDRQLSLVYQRGQTEDNYWIAGTVFPSEAWTMAGSLLYYTTGVLSLENNWGESVSIKGQEDYALTFNISKHLGANSAFGFNAKMLRSTLADEFTSDALIVDCGALFRFELPELRSDLLVGLAALNIGTALKYFDVYEPLTTTIRLGASCLTHIGEYHTLQWAVDVLERNDENSPRVNAGLEHVYNGFLALRFGYKFGADINEFNCGFGVALKPLKIDYAIALFSELNPAQRVALTWLF